MAKKQAGKRSGRKASVARSSSPAENEIKGTSAESRHSTKKAAPAGLWSRIRQMLGR